MEEECVLQDKDRVPSLKNRMDVYKNIVVKKEFASAKQRTELVGLSNI